MEAAQPRDCSAANHAGAIGLVNQYGSRTVPRVLEVWGKTFGENTTVNGEPAVLTDYGYWFMQFDFTGNNSPQTLPITVNATLGNATSTVEGELFLPGHPAVFSYDADGNLLSDGTYAYTYDAENRVRTIAGPGLPMDAAFTYDHAGRVCKAAWNSCETQFLYDGANLIAEMDFLDQYPLLERTYVWGLDVSGTLHGAAGVGGLLMASLQTQEVDGGPSYDPQWTRVAYGYDANGNVMLLAGLDDGAGVLASYAYDPFGQAVQTEGPLVPYNPIRFSTKRALMPNGGDAVLLPATPHLLFPHRILHTALGRWVNQDPLNELGAMLLRGESGREMNLYEEANRYAFVGNDGVNKIDPWGLDRTIYFFGHTWIKVDTYDQLGKKIGKAVLEFSPAHWYVDGESSFSIAEKSTYPEALSFTLKSDATADMKLLNEWQRLKRENRTKWNGINNCLNVSWRLFFFGLPEVTLTDKERSELMYLIIPH